MNKFKVICLTLGFGLFWFFLLPFKFEKGWSLFGGYKLVKVALPYSDGFQHEINISNAFYSSHVYLFILLVVSLLLGYLTLLVYKKIKLQAK